MEQQIGNVMSKKLKDLQEINGALEEKDSSLDKSLPRALYSSKELPIGDVVLECAVLDNGMRVLTATSVFKVFGRPRKGVNSRLEVDGTRLPPFIAAKNLKDFITQDLIDRTKLIEYIDGKSKKSGYEANLIPKMCEVYLKARRSGALVESQQKLAITSEILSISLAQVGIDALVDEATGYQHERKYDALRLLLSKYIAEGLQGWIKTFRDDFFSELDRLYGNSPTSSRKRPSYYGKFINKYVYEPLENGYVKEKLNELNILPDGRRKARFHQWLNSDGREMLLNQIGRTQGLMEASSSIESFKRKAAKRKMVSIAPFLFEEMNNLDD